MTRNRTLLIVVAVAAAAIAAYWFLLLAPKREEIAALDRQIAGEQAKLEQAQTLLASYEQARKSYKANYATLARLGKAVPADDDVRSLLVQIDDAAERSGVDFGTIEIGAGGGVPATEPGDGELAAAPGTVPFGTSGFTAMPFNFSFTGSFFDLSAFFARLERFVSLQNQQIDVNGRLLRLESFTLQPAPAGFPEIQAQIGAATYLVPPAEDLLGGATPEGPAAGGATPPTTEAAGPAPDVPTATATGGAR